MYRFAPLTPHERALQAGGRAPGVQWVSVSPDRARVSISTGVANVARKEKLTENHLMMAYSMTKFVTAVAALRLVEEGRLDLDAPASRYMADLPYGDSLRVRHLLSQSAGIPNPIPLRWVHGVNEHASFDAREKLREHLRKYPRLRFTPGTRYAYSNLSYWILGARGTGLLFGPQADNRGRPLPMTLGLHVDARKGLLYKEGGGAGFHSELRIYPKANAADVVMANSTGFQVKAFLNALRR